MHYRKLGSTEAEISEIGFGACHIGTKESEVAESIRALCRAFELGVNFVDTAPPHDEGRNEKLVGQAIGKAFSQVFAATKVPAKNGVGPASHRTPIEEMFPYRHIVDSTERSLRNLGLEQIYLQQFETWNDSWTEKEEWRRAVEDLRSTGKVRFMGISANEQDPDSALAVIGTGLIQAVQVVYNIFNRSAETNLFPLCRKMKVGVLVRAPLDHGALTGTITPDTIVGPDESREAYFAGDREQQVADRVRAIREDLKDVPGTLAEIALSFCLANQAVTSVIPGMSRVSTVESSCQVSSAGQPTARTMEVLRRHQWKRSFYQQDSTI